MQRVDATMTARIAGGSEAAMQVTRAAPAATPANASAAALVFDLFKLRIGLVIAVTALAGAAITPGPAPAAWQSIALFVGVALSAAAAGAFNQFHERDIDARMMRTRRRAFVTGRLAHHRGWLFTIAVIGASGVLLVGAATNVAAAAYSALGAIVYGFVYTVWLKRRTAWNIVIGGLAGSCAVLCGASAVVAQLPAVSLAFALVLFLWTPPHFWSLAIACRDDYVAARVPMLPVLIGNTRAARVVHFGTIVVVVASVLPALFGAGRIYLAAALVAGAAFVWTGRALARAPTGRRAMTHFHLSLAHLSVLLLAVFVDAAWHGSP